MSQIGQSFAGFDLDNTAQWISAELGKIENDLLARTAAAGATGVRELRPFDLIGISTLTNLVSPSSIAAGSYGYTVANGTTATIAFRVQQGTGMAFVGWYVDGDLGTGGYLQVQVDSVVRQEIAAHIASNSQNKKVYAFGQVVFVRQGSNVSLIISNAASTTTSATVWPIAFIAGTRSVLQMALG